MPTTQVNYDPVKLAQSNNAFNAAEAAKQRSAEYMLFQAGNQFNAAEAAKNRDWQSAMSNSAHQREIKDLQAAGLNPVLSATGGNGASVGSGATASSVGVPGLSKADADTSANAALASLYNASLQYDAQLKAIDTNARTNLQIAKEQAAASRYSSDRSSAASMYNAALQAATQQGINTRQLDQQLKLAQYDFDKQMEYRGFDRETQQQILQQQQNFEEQMKRDYPSNPTMAAAVMGSKLGNIMDYNGISKGYFISPLGTLVNQLFQMFRDKYHYKSRSTHY